MQFLFLLQIDKLDIFFEVFLKIFFNCLRKGAQSTLFSFVNYVTKGKGTNKINYINSISYHTGYEAPLR